MIYLTGATNDTDEPRLIAAGVGLMAQPGNSYHRRVGRYPVWAADNGCYRDRWTEEPWLEWLDRLPRDRCLFAVAPDVYPDAAATLERSRPFFQLVRDMGFPVALVAQDGAENLGLPWDEFDVLFVGGERKSRSRDEWKVGPHAERLARKARAEGKWVHMGRVNSLERLERARTMGCNSADGTFLKYRRRAALDHVREQRGAREIENWYRWLALHPPLFGTLETPSLPVHRDAFMGGAA